MSRAPFKVLEMARIRIRRIIGIHFLLSISYLPRQNAKFEVHAFMSTSTINYAQNKLP